MKSFKYSWVIKALVQSAVSKFPAAAEINYILQRNLGALKKPKFYSISNTMQMVRDLDAQELQINNACVVEIGTGWSLASAITLSTFKPAQLITYDIHPHVRQWLFERAVTEAIVEFRRQPLVLTCNAASRPLKTEDSKTPFKEFMRTRNIVYRAPGDAAKTNLPSESVDIIYSLAVFEHIPPAALEGILKECYRILKPSGRMYHYIQPEDHARKCGANRVTFLGIGSFWWKTFINNSLNYQNRLRDSHYEALLRRFGFTILDHRRTIFPEDLERVRSMKKSCEFVGYDDSDLATAYCWYLCSK